MNIISEHRCIGHCFAQCSCGEEILEFVRDNMVAEARIVDKHYEFDRAEAYYFKCYESGGRTVKDNSRWFMFDDKEQVRKLANTILEWANCTLDEPKVLFSGLDTSVFRCSQMKFRGYFHIAVDDLGYIGFTKYVNEKAFKKEDPEKDSTCTWDVVLTKTVAKQFAKEILRILDIPAAVRE